MASRTIVAACALLFATPLQAVTTSVVDVPTRGVTQRILYLQPDAPVANLLLLTGGSGALGIQPNGTMTSSNASCSPSTRNRDAFAAHGYAVAAVDAASDGNFARYEDLLEIVRYMQRRSQVPTWIMSVSSSTVPVVAFAGGAPMHNGLGLILVSPDPVSPEDASHVSGPAFVVGHQFDPFNAGGTVFSNLVNANPREILALTGGSDAGCAGYHTLNGLNGPFTAAVFGFIDRVNPSLAFVPLDIATADGVEYYNAALDHYFVTHIAGEIALLDAGTAIKGWTKTGQSLKVLVSAAAGTSPVCRFYIPPSLGDSHFYGRGTAECNATATANPSFVNEDPQFFHMTLPTQGICSPGTRNVYRVFSGRPDANHRYMVDPAIRAAMVAKGWIAEGDGADLVAMCAPV
ncbi:MAG: hypothetical protein U1F41_03605 [Burkholderiales bacterium]